MLIKTSKGNQPTSRIRCMQCALEF